MKKIKLWIMKYYDQLSNVFSSVISIGLSLLASFFYDLIKTNESQNKVDNRDLYVMITLCFFVLMFIFISSFISKKIKDRIFKDSKFDIFIQKAYFAIQQLSLECQESLQDICVNEFDYKELSAWAIKCMQLTVEKCYDFFCVAFESDESLIHKIKFEVTFMTVSYIDSKITIPCSCNKERKTPTSMLKRMKGVQNIYDNTITAEIYKEYEENCKPSFRVIEDTTDPTNNYNFIYSNQNDRIKSSIVLPILSHKSELLGTLVVHCNSKGFFMNTKRDFWYEIMQLFASEIGRYKLMLDYIVKKGDKPF